ncbi:hypothetical protein [Powai lake megavirus]|uniref:Uncharacterized protein n=1 Tax=Powai lake megavirus TaxID=1842663 RepID=A0A167RBJ3_9VIRU|nr:hypothetical protein QJ849_gp340 [Powai lake megavirus]ANB50502.1 hypothetical protein [Powai lake megavirus]
MDNINLHYNGLHKLNPLVKDFTLIKYCWENNKQYLDQITNLNISNPNTDNYIEPESCPIYFGTTDPELTIINGEPCIIKYNIFFTVAHLNNKPILKIKKKYNTYAFYDYSFYDNFFYYNPVDIKETQCRGDKCRNDFHVSDCGIWCESCHGDFSEYVSNLDTIIVKKLNFAHFPKESIINIVPIYSPVDYDNLDNLKVIIENLTLNRDNLEQLDNKINNWESDMEKYIEKYKKDCKKQQEINILRRNELVSIHGLDIDDYNSLIKKFNNSITKIKLDNEITEQTKKLKLLEDELLKQRQSIEDKNKILELELSQVQKKMDQIKKYSQEVEDKKKLLIDQ